MNEDSHFVLGSKKKGTRDITRQIILTDEAWYSEFTKLSIWWSNVKPISRSKPEINIHLKPIYGKVFTKTELQEHYAFEIKRIKKDTYNFEITKSLTFLMKYY